MINQEQCVIPFAYGEKAATHPPHKSPYVLILNCPQPLSDWS